MSSWPRKARFANDAMNCCAHASSCVWHGRITLFSRFVSATAACARLSAACWYCWTMSALTLVYVFVSKFTPDAIGLSATNAVAGWVVSPRRSRTMLSYSTREIRRTGDQSTRGPPGEQSDLSLMSAVLIGPGAATTTPPSPSPGASPRSGVACPVVAHAPARHAIAPAARTPAGKAMRGTLRLMARTPPRVSSARTSLRYREPPSAAQRSHRGIAPVSMNGHCVACDA